MTVKRVKYAKMWACGDECYCLQPEIRECDIETMNNSVVVESGAFGDYTMATELYEWLLEAAKRHNCINIKEIEE